MPRGGPPTYNYSLPPIYLAIPGTLITAAQHNTPLEDLANTFNVAWPVPLGGTGGTTPAALLAGLNDFTATQSWNKGDDIASASTLTLGQDGNYFHVTGTTGITSISTKRAGTIIVLKFNGVLALTYNATSLILPGAANIATAPDDTAIFVSEGSGNWRCVAYQRAAAAPLAGTQAWEQIGAPQIITTSTPNVSWANLSAYRNLRLTWWARPVTDGAMPLLRISTDNGSSYLTTGYINQILNVNAATVSGVRDTTFTGLSLSGAVGNNGDERAWGPTFITEFNTAGNGLVATTGAGYFDGSTVFQSRDIKAWAFSASTRNALRFVFDSGAIALGYFLLEGSRG